MAHSLLRIGSLSLLAALVSVGALASTDTETQTITTSENPEEIDNTEVTSRTEVNRVRVGTGDEQVEPGQAGSSPANQGNQDVVERTEITEREVRKSSFRDEAVGIKPQVGAVFLDEASGSGETRGVAGMTLDFNLLRRVSEGSAGKPYLGPSFGIFYSHLGNGGSDFFGLNSPAGGDEGTHLLMLPVNLKVGYTFSDVARLAIHGGINALYNNVEGGGGTVRTNAFGASDSSWSANPNLGFDVELGLGKNAALLIRPDWTFADLDTFFTGTLGLSIPIS